MDMPGLVVFDLDGTLVDTAPDLTAALNHALGRLGRPAIDPATVRHLVGHGARALIERGLALTGGERPGDAVAALPLFLNYYAEHICDGSRPYDGAAAVMDELAALGCRLAICTNKPVALSQRLVAALGWEDRFAANLGGDSLAVRKPDAGHLLGTIAASGGSAADTVFVGDTTVDVAAARGAGVPVIVVAFGFGADPEAMGADAVIEHFDALNEAITLVRRR